MAAIDNARAATGGSAISPASAAFRAYRDSIPTHLWTPELGEGFFKGWEAHEAQVQAVGDRDA